MKTTVEIVNSVMFASVNKKVRDSMYSYIEKNFPELLVDIDSNAFTTNMDIEEMIDLLLKKGVVVVSKSDFDPETYTDIQTISFFNKSDEIVINTKININVE